MMPIKESYREELIKLCYAILNGDPAIQQRAVGLLQDMGITSECEDCRQPATPGIRWCPSCFDLHYDGSPGTLDASVLVPNDGDL